MEYVFHKLIPIKEVEPNWFKLKWKPIKNGTWNFFSIKESFSYWSIKFRKTSVHNGWHRSYDGFMITIKLGKMRYEFWMIYNLICHRNGASDVAVADIKPLDFSKSKFAKP